MQVREDLRPAVGVVPFGTANDFAQGCGIPIGNPLAALELIISADAVAIDVGCCNSQYFINVASGGFGAEVTATTPPAMKKAIGGAAYSLMGLVTAMKMSPYRVRVTTDDGEIGRGDLFVVAVGNGRQAGGGYQVTPRALLNDGLLDVIGVVDVEVSNLGGVFGELADVASDKNKYVRYSQLSKFRIESDSPMQMNLDGESTRNTTFDFRVEPGALRFLLPEGAPLVG